MSTDSSLRQRMREALPAALTSRDRTAVAALRSTLAAIENAEAVGPTASRGLAIEESPRGVGAAEVARRDLTEADVRAIVSAEITERRTAAEGYERAGRPDRADVLRAEADVLAAMLD